MINRLNLQIIAVKDAREHLSKDQVEAGHAGDYDLADALRITVECLGDALETLSAIQQYRKLFVEEK